MTVTIDIPEKIVDRAAELGVPVATLLSQTFDALLPSEPARSSPMINFARQMRVTNSGSITLTSRADRAYLAKIRKDFTEHVDRVTKTAEAALQDLVDAGICQPDGQLSEHYR
jgi:hypothetical protein